VLNTTITPRRSAFALLTLAALLAVTTSCGGGDDDKVALIGDSITDMSRDPLTTALGEGRTLEIVGKFGARTDQVLPEVEVIAASDPGAAIVNIGTNDAIQQVPADRTAANIQKILNTLDGVGCRYLVQINEAITDKATGASRSAEAAAVNRELDRLADENAGVEVLPWNRTIAENGGNGAVTFDTVHLNDKGIVLLADTYRDALDRC